LPGAAQALDGTVMGTPAFMAPEQALGRIAELDARTDVYAFGAILYNILTPRSPISPTGVCRWHSPRWP
jgi:serine/threonine-protein kinase